MNNQQHIKIIGGGMAGLSLALACKTNGIGYDLYEQQAEITYQNVGLGISANIFPILERWGILEDVKQIGTEIKTFHFVDPGMKPIKSFTMKRPALSVNRRLFHELLKTKLDSATIHLHSPKTTADFSENDIVISAEGISSETRKRIYPQIKLRDSNQILWRGISKIKLTGNFENSYYDFVGNNLRFAIIHLGKDFYSWYMIKTKKNEEKVTLDKQLLKHYFKDYHPLVAQVIDQSQQIYFSEISDIKPDKRKGLKWFVKNNLMIGDAIHPTTPNMANGACLAMEDSYLLSNLLMDKRIPAETIFSKFQKQRTSKINPIVRQSWMLGKILHQKSTLVNYLLKVALKVTPEWFFNQTYSKVLVEVKAEDC